MSLNHPTHLYLLSVLQSYHQQLKLVSFRQKLTCTFLTHLGVINVKSLATMNSSVCANCGMPEHCPSGQRQRPARCANCSGDHPANSKQCPTWEKEKKILKIKCEQNITFPEARKQLEQFNAVQTYASAVKPSKQTQTEDKDTQTDDSFTEYLKQQTASEKTSKEKTNEKQGKGTSSLSPGPAHKPGTLEMMKKEEESKKKEEKDKIKQQQEEERRQKYHKDKQEKELKEKEQAEKSQQNPFSVLLKDDEVVCMEEKSPVTIYLKAHCLYYQ